MMVDEDAQSQCRCIVWLIGDWSQLGGGWTHGVDSELLSHALGQFRARIPS